MKSKEEYIKYYINLGGNPTIIKFTYDLLYSQGISGVEYIRNMFSCGYCYYYAKMLQDAFPGGEICVCYPYGHIVYIYDKIPYDIDGISSADAYDFIPIDFLGEAINDFRHIDGIQYNITPRQLEKLGERWRLTQKPIEINNVWLKLLDDDTSCDRDESD